MKAPVLVLGLYEDTGQVFTAQVNDLDAQGAMIHVAREATLESDGESTLIILGAVTANARRGGAGVLMDFITPDVDGGLGAYADDLVGGGDDDSTA